MKKSQIVKIIQMFFLISYLVVSSGFAKDLYVSTTGNDTVPYANNNISNPWATPAKAWYNAQAGDTVYFRAGTYNVSSTINTNSPNGYNGIADSPITFTTYPDEAVTLNATGGSGVMFQISKNYNIVKNFTINAGNYYNRIFGVGWYDGDKSVTGFTADNLKLSNWRDGDNSNAFYIGSSYASVTATKIIIKNCTLTGRPGAGHQNYCGIQVFGATEFSIENNEVSQAIVGIINKHSSYGVTDHDDIIKNNYVHSLNPGALGALRVNGNYVDVINNIFDGVVQFGEDAESGSNPNGTYIHFYHNTIVGPFEQLYDGGGIHAIFENNIFKSTAYIFRYSSNPDNPQIDETDYNLYSSSAVSHKGTTYSLANWRSHLVAESTGGSRDANSISDTPIFEGGTTPTTILGYKLTTNSAGYQTASDGTDKGADVSLVGPNAAIGVLPLPGDDNSPLSAPTSLEIVE